MPGLARPPKRLIKVNQLNEGMPMVRLRFRLPVAQDQDGGTTLAVRALASRADLEELSVH
jgi:hypothetical protein